MVNAMERLLDQVEWREVFEGWQEDDMHDKIPLDPPVATHEGILTIGPFKLRCYKLSNGKRVIHADDVEKLLKDEV